LAVGIEREWSGHASGPAARFAGARTFLLLGVTGGSAGLLLDWGNPLAAAVLLAGAAALAVTAYAVVAQRAGEDWVDGTTEAAALAVLALASLAGMGHQRLAAAAVAVMVLALREKTTIHRLVRGVDEVELRAALQFAVLALVFLPILPEGPFGPLGGIRPRELWLVVLLVSGLNFAGYFARRLVDDTQGTTVAGMLGGLISSTAVTLTFSRQSRDEPERAVPLALGVVGACTVLLPRLLGLAAVLAPALAAALVPFFLPPLLAGAGMVALGFHRRPAVPSVASLPTARNPLRLGAAMLLAAGFQAVLMIMVFMRDHFGVAGVLTSAGVLGLTDMDALTLSMSRLAGQPGQLQLAAVAIAIGVLSNTALKLTVILTLGTARFRRLAGMGLLLLGAASGLGLWIGTH